MLSLKPQEITDAHTGVQLALGRHPGENNTQWARITANGKVSTVYFHPDGQIKNIQNHPKPVGFAAAPPNDAPAESGVGLTDGPLGANWHDRQAANHPEPEAARAELDANRATGVAQGETVKQLRERREASYKAKREALEEAMRALDEEKKNAVGNDPDTDKAQPWMPGATEPDTDEAQPWKPTGDGKPVAPYTYDETSKAIDADIADDNADDAKTAEEIAKIDNDVAQRKSREAAKALVNEDFKPPSGSVPPVATPPIEG